MYSNAYDYYSQNAAIMRAAPTEQERMVRLHQIAEALHVDDYRSMVNLVMYCKDCESAAETFESKIMQGVSRYRKEYLETLYRNAYHFHAYFSTPHEDMSALWNAEIPQDVVYYGRALNPNTDQEDMAELLEEDDPNASTMPRVLFEELNDTPSLKQKAYDAQKLREAEEEERRQRELEKEAHREERLKALAEWFNPAQALYMRKKGYTWKAIGEELQIPSGPLNKWKLEWELMNQTEGGLKCIYKDIERWCKKNGYSYKDIGKESA